MAVIYHETYRKPAPEPMPNADFIAQKPRSYRTSRTLSALILREMSTTYGRTAFGYLWAILEPAAGILLLTLVFSVALRSPALGTSFPLYYASGLLPFMAYLDVGGKITQALRFSRPLMSFPAVTYVDALLARLILNALTQVMVIGMTLAAIIFGFGLDVIINFPVLLSSIFLALLLAFGIGTLNCYLFFRFPIWERIWGIINRPLFFVSCIFFLFETVPEPFSNYLWFNPIVHISGLFRRGIYPGYAADYVSVAYVLGVSLICLLLGLLLLRRHHREMLNS